MVRQGISEFIATLLLVVLVVSGGILVYAYTMGYVGGFWSVEELGALTIDEVDGNKSRILLYVRNIGETGCNITRAYIDGKKAFLQDQPLQGKNTAMNGWVYIDECDVKDVYIFFKGGKEDTYLSKGTYVVKLVTEDNTQLMVNVEVT